MPEDLEDAKVITKNPRGEEFLDNGLIVRVVQGKRQIVGLWEPKRSKATSSSAEE